MSKKLVPQDQKMTDITAFETDPDKLVEEAKGWAIALWRSAGRQSGNSQRAMYRAAGWAKVPPNTLWKLRYRPPRDLGVSIYNRLRVAYVERVEAVEGQVAENLAALRELPSTEANQRLIAEMEKFLGLAEGPEAGCEAFDGGRRNHVARRFEGADASEFD